VVTKLGGILRGIVKDGLTVAAGTKLADIDPRGDVRALARISEKAWTIADAVLRVVRARGILPEAAAT
jgi:xanthine dehydrogenase accessory factor